MQIPGALGIARPAQPPTRAPIGFPPPPRASQGAQALPSRQLELRADPGRAPSRRAAQFGFQADAHVPSPGRYSRDRGRAASRLPSRSRTPIARRRSLPVSAPPDRGNQVHAYDPYQVWSQPAPPVMHCVLAAQENTRSSGPGPEAQALSNSTPQPLDRLL